MWREGENRGKRKGRRRTEWENRGKREGRTRRGRKRKAFERLPVARCIQPT